MFGVPRTCVVGRTTTWQEQHAPYPTNITTIITATTPESAKAIVKEHHDCAAIVKQIEENFRHHGEHVVAKIVITLPRRLLQVKRCILLTC